MRDWAVAELAVVAELAKSFGVGGRPKVLATSATFPAGERRSLRLGVIGFLDGRETETAIETA